MKKIFALAALFMLCAAGEAWAQLQFTGKVVDAQTGRPLIGATVRLEKTTLASATDTQGLFSLEAPHSGQYVLRASCTGYAPRSKVVEQSQTGLIFTLKPVPIPIDQVVVTGTGTHRKLNDSPIPVQVITASDIRKTGVTNLEDALLRLNPSFNIRPTAMGSNFTMNGLSNKYIQILIDGKKMAGDVSDNTDLSRIDMTRVKRIEVLSGAASALYGSEAIAGVVNLITEQPHDQLSVRSSTRVGGKGEFQESAAVDLNSKKFSSSTAYQYKRADGWQLNTCELDDKELIPTGKQVVNQYRSHIASQRFTYTPTEKLDFYLQGSFYDKRILRPTAGYTYDFNYLDYNYGLGAKYLLRKGSYLNLDLYTDNYEYTKIYTVDSKTVSAGERELDKRQRYTNLNLKGVFRVGNHHKFTVGTEALFDYLKRPGDLAAPKSAYTMALYAQDEIRIGQHFQAVPGVRYLYHETFGNQVIPKISLLYSLGSFNLRGSYAAGFKAPNLRELYYDYESRGSISIGDPNLKPEKANTYSVNLEFSRPWLTASVSAYRNDINNIIVKKRVPLTGEDAANGIKKRYLYANIDKTRTQGIEISLSSYLGAGFSAGGAYNFVDARNRKTDEHLTEIVRHAATVRTSWTHQWETYTLSVNLSGRIQGRKYFTDAKGNDESAVGYQFWTLTSNHSFGAIGKFLFDLNLGVDNLFDYVDDRPYGVNYATLSPGRTLFAELIIRFKK